MVRHSLKLTPRRPIHRSVVTFASISIVVLAATAGIASVRISDFAVEAFAAPKQQRRQNQKSSSSSGGGWKKNKPSKVGGNKNWYEKRKAGVKVQSRGPKPPKWEKEGDDLYVNHNNKSDSNENTDRSPTRTIQNYKDITYEEARELLRPFEKKGGADANLVTPKPPSPKTNDDNDDDANDQAEKPFLWGGLSIGPVWKSRLVQAGYQKPTPIQVASYATLSHKKNQTSINGNAIIAASTGSGKSLAYLLPFLTSIDTNNLKKKQKQQKQADQSPIAAAAAASVTSALGKIWIVTPTMELAYQLQRTVDRVIVGDGNDGNNDSSDVLHVVEYNRGVTNEQQSSFSTSFPILSDIVNRYYGIDSTTTTISQEPTFLAGTPKLFVQLRKEIKKCLASTTKADSNIRYAKQREARKLREASEGMNRGHENDDEETEAENIEEQLLYRKVALALNGNLQTLILDEVDRLLQTTTAMTRREHKTTKPLAQELLEALVWESKSKPTRGKPNPRAGPSAYSSKLQIVCASATVGRSLRRQLMYMIQAPSMDKAAILITADVRTKKNAELRKASLLPSNLKHSYRIVSVGSEKSNNVVAAAGLAAATATLKALVATLQTQTPPAPSLVFPGTIGVETVRDHLINCGFADVRGLSSLRSEKKNSSSEITGQASPLDTPVYVVKERLARGLDLPEVKRVILLGVPNNAAAYAHLAGRTARQNTPGECLVVCKPSEAPKLVSIAETLGLYQWRCHLAQQHQTGDAALPVENSKKPIDDDWDLTSMSKTAIRSKKVSELPGFLDARGVSTKGLLKDSLVDAILQVKESDTSPTG